MNSPFLISLGAGLVSAVLFMSTATGSLLAMILFCLVALPGFIVGLGWGTRSALVAALSAGALVTTAIGPAAGGVYVATLGLPVVLLCYLALLSRPPGTAEAADPADMEWYPIGRLMAWATLLAGVVASLSVPLLGWDAETYRSTAKNYFDTTIFSQLPVQGPDGLDKEKLEPVKDLLVLLLPATSSMVWLGIMLANMWAGGKIIELSGRSIRPWPQIATLTYPRNFSLGFFAATLLTFAPGIVAIVATGFAGAFLFAYIVMGLVVLHVIAARSAFRTFLLIFLYLAIILIGWIAILVAFIGLGEPVFRFRERALKKPKPPEQPGM